VSGEGIQKTVNERRTDSADAIGRETGLIRRLETPESERVGILRGTREILTLAVSGPC